MAHVNKPVPGAYQYFPLNEPAIGERKSPNVSTNPLAMYNSDRYVNNTGLE